MPDNADKTRALSSEESEVFDQIFRNGVWVRCLVARGTEHLVTRVVPRQASNPFAPTLEPLRARRPGYYAFRLYSEWPDVAIDFAAQSLTKAEMLNGTMARYVVRLFAPAYKFYDPTTGWSPYQGGHGSERDKIVFASYTVTRRYSTWHVDARLNILTNGRFERPRCDEVPS